MEAKGRGMIETLPEQPRAGMFELLKKFAATYSDVAVTKEAITGDTARVQRQGSQRAARDRFGADDERSIGMEGRHRKVVVRSAVDDLSPISGCWG